MIQLRSSNNQSIFRAFSPFTRNSKQSPKSEPDHITEYKAQGSSISHTTANARPSRNKIQPRPSHLMTHTTTPPQWVSTRMSRQNEARKGSTTTAKNGRKWPTDPSRKTGLSKQHTTDQRAVEHGLAGKRASQGPGSQNDKYKGNV